MHIPGARVIDAVEDHLRWPIQFHYKRTILIPCKRPPKHKGFHYDFFVRGFIMNQVELSDGPLPCTPQRAQTADKVINTSVSYDGAIAHHLGPVRIALQDELEFTYGGII